MVAKSWLPPQGPSIKQFMDIFSLPEMALLSCVVDYFLGHSLEFDQVHLYKDVTVRTSKVCVWHGRPSSIAYPHYSLVPSRMPSGMCT